MSDFNDKQIAGSRGKAPAQADDGKLIIEGNVAAVEPVQVSGSQDPIPLAQEPVSGILSVKEQGTPTVVIGSQPIQVKGAVSALAQEAGGEVKVKEQGTPTVVIGSQPIQVKGAVSALAQEAGGEVKVKEQSPITEVKAKGSYNLPLVQYPNGRLLCVPIGTLAELQQETVSPYHLRVSLYAWDGAAFQKVKCDANGYLEIKVIP